VSRARDPYTTTKLLQEEVVRDVVATRASVVVLRAGVVYGPGETWSLRLGFQVRPGLWVLVGGGARVPLVHVDDCAAAVLLGAEQEVQGHLIVNLVGDETPTQRSYVHELLDATGARPDVVRVPLAIVKAASWLLEFIDQRLFEGDLRLPSALSRSAVAARYTSFRYSNRRAVHALGWRPRLSVAEGLRRSARGEEVREGGGHGSVAANGGVPGPAQQALRGEAGVAEQRSDGGAR
jgi:nucleoside-diphosphate-sugar epimerase